MFRGGGGFGRFPMTDNPIQLLVAVLLFALLLWVIYRFLTS